MLYPVISTVLYFISMYSTVHTLYYCTYSVRSTVPVLRTVHVKWDTERLVIIADA